MTPAVLMAEHKAGFTALAQGKAGGKSETGDRKAMVPRSSGRRILGALVSAPNATTQAVPKLGPVPEGKEPGARLPRAGGGETRRHLAGLDEEASKSEALELLRGLGRKAGVGEESIQKVSKLVANSLGMGAREQADRGPDAAWLEHANRKDKQALAEGSGEWLEHPRRHDSPSKPTPASGATNAIDKAFQRMAGQDKVRRHKTLAHVQALLDDVHLSMLDEAKARMHAADADVGSAMDVRAGDAIALDLVWRGFSSLVPHHHQLQLMIQVNGSDFLWEGSIGKSALAGIPHTVLLDLPLGTHRVGAGMYVAEQSMASGITAPALVLRVRRVMPPPRPDLRGTQLPAPRPPALPSDWQGGAGGECSASALCRVMQQWWSALEAVEKREAPRGKPLGVFLTSYTLLGHALYGWHVPWRGDHRWDRGASSPHSRFKMHYTPWKDRIYLGLAEEAWTAGVSKAMDLELAKQRQAGRARWTVLKSGSQASGRIITFTHSFDVQVILFLLQRSEDGGGDRLRATVGLESELGLIRHSATSCCSPDKLVSVATLGGRYLLPGDVDLHLLESFGPGFDKVYAPSKWQAHHAGPLDQPPSPPDFEPGVRGQPVLRRRRGLVLSGHGVLDTDCWRVDAGSDAAWESPRIKGHSKPRLDIGDVFSVYLCVPEAKEANAGRGQGQGLVGARQAPAVDGVIKLRAAAGTIVVVRETSCPAARRGFLNPGPRSGDMEAAAARMLGPDELVVDLMGPELLALRQEHLGGCAYAFPFEVTLAGPFRLTVQLLRSNFSALDEVSFSSAHPTMHFDQVLGSQTWLSFLRGSVAGHRRVEDIIEGRGLGWCGAEVQGDWQQASPAGRWVSPYASTLFGARDSLLLSKGLQPCPRRQDRNPAFRAGGSGRVWPVDYGAYLWTPYQCKQRFFRPEEASACLALRSRRGQAGGPRMLFTGDSHMRTLFNSLLKYACGVPEAAQKGHHTSQCHEGGSRCGGGAYCLEHNMLGWLDALHTPDKWDVLVANLGHHAAAGAEHWTLEEYRAHIEAYLSSLEARMLSDPHASSQLVWIASHAMPLARDAMLIGSTDWRTNQRLQLYERQAQLALQGLRRRLGSRVLYLDAFNLTLPFIEAAAGDCGHFMPANVQTALVQDLLNLLCPAGA